MRNRYYDQLTQCEKIEAFKTLMFEIKHLPDDHRLVPLVHLAWDNYVSGKFSYDGATFARNRFKNTPMEAAALIHDWRNSQGFVSYQIDDEMLSIMVELKYPIGLIKERMLLTRLTFLNIIRHWFLRSLKFTKPQIYQYEANQRLYKEGI